MNTRSTDFLFLPYYRIILVQFLNFSFCHIVLTIFRCHTRELFFCPIFEFLFFCHNFDFLIFPFFGYFIFTIILPFTIPHNRNFVFVDIRRMTLFYKMENFFSHGTFQFQFPNFFAFRIMLLNFIVVIQFRRRLLKIPTMVVKYYFLIFPIRYH